MGGGTAALSMVGSVLGMVSNMSKAHNRPEAPDNSAQLEAQRRAREEEQRKEEAAQRHKDRERVLEAREMDKKRAAAKGKTTLSAGAAGLLEEPDVAAAGLKSKLGE